MEISTADWDALQSLARRVGLSAERVGMLRRRVEDISPRPGAPYVLVVGRPEAGIELVLGRWLAPEAAEELQATFTVFARGTRSPGPKRPLTLISVSKPQLTITCPLKKFFTAAVLK
jgi:hypothetical protein